MNKIVYSIVLMALLFGLTRCKKEIISVNEIKRPGAVSIQALNSDNLIFEAFDYPVGTLNGTGGWVRIGGTEGQTQLSAGSLTYPGYLPAETGNKVELIPANTEDLNLNFGEQSGAGTKIYASMLINVTAASATGDYFAHFFGNLFKSRIMIKANGTGFNIGLDGGSASATYLPEIYNFNQTYLVVASYEFVDGSGNDIASLWINPDISGTEPAPALTNVPVGNDDSSLNGFRLRQNTASTSPTLSVDGIKVGLSWAGSVLATEKGIQPVSVSDSVTVEFAGGSGRVIDHVASGFLHGFTTDGLLPADDKVLPLKIHMVRSTPPAALTQADRMKQLGIKQQVVISDNWYFGYTSSFMPGDNGDWSLWDNFVTNQVNDVIKKGMADNVEFDVWNEADHPFFWPRPKTQALAAYYRAYIRIRALLPNAIIVGPSISSNSGDKVIEFLKWAKSAQKVPDVVSWHFPSDVVREVKDVRDYLKANNLSHVKININEYALPADQYAGKHAWLIAQLERAEVDGAIHAIWSDQSTGTLDDILTPSLETKASWWVYKRYGNVAGKTVRSTPGKYVDLFAGKNEQDKTIRVLLGTKATLPPGDVKIRFQHLSKAFPGVIPASGSFHVKVERIPENSGGVVNALETVYEADVTNRDNYTLTIPWASARDAYVVHLGTPPVD